MTKPAHRLGTYQARAAAVRVRANADLNTECWRCGRTLAQHPPHKTGAAVKWTAGHVVDGHPDSVLLPEASTCNYTDGARHGNGTRGKVISSRRW